MTTALPRPPEVFDREAEWDDLAAFAASDAPGLAVGVLYGRRRQGKSFLLRSLVEGESAFYHQALEEEPRPALRRFGERTAERVGLAAGAVDFADWDEALRALIDLPPARRPRLFVLDEFPYLVRGAPELPSVVQRLYDEERSGPPMRLVLCGSAVSVMTDVLSGGRALRGRATLDLALRPFDFRTARAFWGIDDPGVAFRVHAILGGTPGYRDLLGTPPRSPGGLGRWLAGGILSPAHALFREPEYLLAEEPAMTDRGLYQSVLAAVARGARTPGAVARDLGRDEGSVRYPLRMLEGAGLLLREADVLRQRHPTLRAADPILRFHHVVVRPNLARLEARRAEEVWKDAGPSFSSQVLGPHFEHLARRWTLSFASEESLGGPVAEVGRTGVGDPDRRIHHEIDVVALAPGGRRRPEVRLLGEAKWGSALGLGDLRRLERVRELLGRGDRADASGTRLALFGAGRFAKELRDEVSTRPDVLLVDLERLYEGD